jgi:hypothetical protein
VRPACCSRERELELIRQQYLGAEKQKKKIVRASERFRWVCVALLLGRHLSARGLRRAVLDALQHCSAWRGRGQTYN